jgi:hypothetical protein
MWCFPLASACQLRVQNTRSAVVRVSRSLSLATICKAPAVMVLLLWLLEPKLKSDKLVPPPISPLQLYTHRIILCSASWARNAVFESVSNPMSPAFAKTT